MSLTRPEKILVSVVLIILFIVSNIAAFLIIQKVLNVSMFDSDYDITKNNILRDFLEKECILFMDYQMV